MDLSSIIPNIMDHGTHLFSRDIFSGATIGLPNDIERAIFLCFLFLYSFLIEIGHNSMHHFSLNLSSNSEYNALMAHVSVLCMVAWYTCPPFLQPSYPSSTYQYQPITSGFGTNSATQTALPLLDHPCLLHNCANPNHSSPTATGEKRDGGENG